MSTLPAVALVAQAVEMVLEEVPAPKVGEFQAVVEQVRAHRPSLMAHILPLQLRHQDPLARLQKGLDHVGEVAFSVLEVFDVVQAGCHDLRPYMLDEAVHRRLERLRLF